MPRSRWNLVKLLTLQTPMIKGLRGLMSGQMRNSLTWGAWKKKMMSAIGRVSTSSHQEETVGIATAPPTKGRTALRGSEPPGGGIREPEDHSEASPGEVLEAGIGPPPPPPLQLPGVEREAPHPAGRRPPAPPTPSKSGTRGTSRALVTWAI